MPQYFIGTLRNPQETLLLLRGTVYTDIQWGNPNLNIRQWMDHFHCLISVVSRSFILTAFTSISKLLHDHRYMTLCENREDEIQTLKAEIKVLRKTQEKKAGMNLRRRSIHGCLPLVKKEGLIFWCFIKLKVPYRLTWLWNFLRDEFSFTDEQFLQIKWNSKHKCFQW